MPRFFHVVLNLSLKVGAAFVSLLVTILIARKLGAEEAGAFLFAQNITLVLIASSRFGFDNSIVREASRLDRVADVEALQRSFTTGLTIMASAATVLAALVYLGVHLAASVGTLAANPYSKVTSVLALSLPFLASSAAIGFFLQATRYYATSTFLIFAAQPSFFLIFLFAVSPSSSLQAAELFVAAAVCNVIVAFVLLRVLHPKLSPLPSYSSLSSETVRGTRSFWFVSIANQTINLMPMLLLSYFGSSTDIAYYSVALRIANFTGNVVVAVNSYFAPNVSRALAAGMGELRRTIVATQLYTFVIGAPILLAPIIFPELILSFFGESFKGATIALVIIAAGQFFNMMTSSTSVLLGMSGKERLMSIAGFIALTWSLTAGLVFVPSQGLIGASFVGVSTLVVQNSLYLLFAMRLLLKSHRDSIHNNG